MRGNRHPLARVAVVSFHTSPLDQPGIGDSGGMNVYLRMLAAALGERGVQVDVFSRRTSEAGSAVRAIGPLARVIQVEAGPPAPVPKRDLLPLVPEFATEVVRWGRDRPYDLVHAHYWLSGWAGRAARMQWGVPLVSTFHTLGRVKNLSLARDDSPEPQVRLDGEQAIIREADRIIVPTAAEARHLVDLYRARVDRLRVAAPGVDRRRFRPLPSEEAKAALGLEGKAVALYAGRLQPHKGPDVAVRAVAEAHRRAPHATEDLRLLVVGGPSGPGPNEVGRLRRIARAEGIEDRVRFHAPVPHERLPRVYAAADLCLVPSRSESFGLVALEAQACGVPVVAADVGGLPVVVADGHGGFVVPGHDPVEYASRMLRILSDPVVAGRTSVAARERAARFSWEETADRVVSVYSELVPALGLDAALAAAR